MDHLKTFFARHWGALLGLACMVLAIGIGLHEHAAGMVDGVPIGMAAVSVTTILGGTNTFIGDVIATADGDVSATITHGLSAGGTPKEVQITKILSVALAADPGWSAAAPGATTCVLTKLATVGSGNAAAQLRVTIKTPHSIGA